MSTTESSQSEGSKAKNFLSSLSNLFLKTAPEDSNKKTQPQQFKEQAEELNSALTQLKSKIEKRRIEASKNATSSRVNDNSSKTSGFKLKVSSPQEIQRELEDSQRKLKQSIVQLNNQLGTTISDNKLQELQNKCIEILASVNTSDTDAKIRKAIVDRVYKEVGPAAWQALNHLMQKQDLKWELPESISSNLSPEQLERNFESRMGEIENLFLNQSFTQATEVLGGVISAWKRYPDEKSWLWQEVSLRAVGTGMRIILFLEAVEKLKAESALLRSRAEELMQENLAKVDEMLNSGLQSIEQAEMLVANGNSIISEIIPELAWELVEELVQRRSSEFFQ